VVLKVFMAWPTGNVLAPVGFSPACRAGKMRRVRPLLLRSDGDQAGQQDTRQVNKNYKLSDAIFAPAILRMEDFWPKGMLQVNHRAAEFQTGTQQFLPAHT
jgi:hypothetical protein